MANILDYLHWRGDLTFDQQPFCDVDALVLCRLSYVPFDGLVAPDFSAQSVELKRAAETCLALVRDYGSKRTFRLEEDARLLEALAMSERFNALALAGYVNRFSPENEEQFSAMTVRLSPGETFIAFRGTDGTIIGWKEDFNMSFSSTVPAQRDAQAYLEQAAARFPGTLRVGGHSKGGNLAVYASAFASPQVQRRIVRVYNNDGPGFNTEVVKAPPFQRIVGRVATFLPQSSIIGMLLEHEEDFSVLHSTSRGLGQHDVYSWEVFRNRFVPVEALTNSSRFIDRTLKDWVRDMSPELREKMIDGVFCVLSASGGVTLRDLWNGKNTIAMLKALNEMDEPTKALLLEAYGILRKSLKKSLPSFVDALDIPNPFSALQQPGRSRSSVLERMRSDLLNEAQGQEPEGKKNQ